MYLKVKISTKIQSSQVNTQKLQKLNNEKLTCVIVEKECGSPQERQQILLQTAEIYVAVNG
jgi:hypothetical protein